MPSPPSTSRSPPLVPPTLPVSTLRATGSAATLHDLLNFPAPSFDPVAHAAPPQAYSPHLGFYGSYQHAAHAQQPQSHDVRHLPSYAQPAQQQQQQQPIASSSALPPHLDPSTGSYQLAQAATYDLSRPPARRNSMASSMTSLDDVTDAQQFSAGAHAHSHPQPHQHQPQLAASASHTPSPAPYDILEVPEEVTAGLSGRQLTEKKRKWRAKQGVQGPGKSWRKGLKDTDRPPPPPPPPPMPDPIYPVIDDVRPRHHLEPDWRSPLPAKKRKELTEKSRSRFVASAPAIKYNQAWITAEPLLNKGAAKTAPVRKWKIGNRMVRSITGRHWQSSSGWAGDVDSPLANLIQDQKAQAAHAAAAALSASLQQPSGTQHPSPSPFPTPGADYLAPPGATPSLNHSPAPPSSGAPQIMPHEKHRLYALSREAAEFTSPAASGSMSREGSVVSVNSDGTAGA